MNEKAYEIMSNSLIQAAQRNFEMSFLLGTAIGGLTSLKRNSLFNDPQKVLITELLDKITLGLSELRHEDDN